MGFDTIHETAIKDIVDAIKYGATELQKVSAPSGVAYSGSLTKATKGLIMEFPVLVSKANHIESAGIVAKAYEAKFVTLLQLAFSAINVTESKDAIDYIRQFHTNLDSKFTVDEFIEIMGESANEQYKNGVITTESYNMFKAVTEDMKNLSFYFDDNIKESSLDSYKIMKNYGSLKVVKEDKDPVDNHIGDLQNTNIALTKTRIQNKLKNNYDKSDLSERQFAYQQQHDRQVDGYRQVQDKKRNNLDGKKFGYQMAHDKQKDDFEKEKFGYQQSHDKQRDDLDREKFGYQQSHDKQKDDFEKEKFGYQQGKDAQDITLKMNKDKRDEQELLMNKIKFNNDFLSNNLISSDVKKANELTPTMMIINFIEVVNGVPTHRCAVIGVKAKLYEVEPVDVITKLITKHVDNNFLLKLVKVSTREISFVKDFLLAIDDAKLDALSNSKRGSTNKLFKVLERRALGGKIRRNLKQKDYAKAISSLVISQEEAEELLKNNIDVHNPRIIRPIMEKLNLISFAIIDESSESVKFLFDTGDDIYETIPLSKLEREQKDGMSKKVINLMAKMNR